MLGIDLENILTNFLRVKIKRNTTFIIFPQEFISVKLLLVLIFFLFEFTT